MRFLIVLFFTFSFADYYPLHNKISNLIVEIEHDTSLADLDDSISVYQNSKDLNSYSSKSPAIALILSGVFPGAGEFYMDKKIRGSIFMGIELAALGTWYYYNNKGQEQKLAYKDFADENWSLSRWISDYYKWDEVDLVDSEGNSLRSIFVGSTVFNEDTSYFYPDIWEDSHHVTYTWNEEPRMVNSNTDDFRKIYREFCGYTAECSFSTTDEIEQILIDKNYKLEKDHHFYENIGKYDHFFAGWEDNDSLYLVVKEEGGEKLAMSPKKAQFREMWTSANEDYFQIATYALSVILANHVASMVDALLLAKLSQYNESVDFSAQPSIMINQFNDFDASLKFSINW